MTGPEGTIRGKVLKDQYGYYIIAIKSYSVLIKGQYFSS